MGQQLANCTATPSVFRGEEDAYLIVNLETNAEGMCDWWFEPMSTQEASNKRYNTDEYKTSKLVFRRIKAGDYPIRRRRTNGMYFGTTAKMERDYYLSVFFITTTQYRLIKDDASALVNGNTKAQYSVSYTTLRGGASATVDVVFDAEGDVIARLNHKTGLYFDLPTMAMIQSAAHAKCPTDWTFWEPTRVNFSKYVCQRWTEVGSRCPIRGASTTSSATAGRLAATR